MTTTLATDRLARARLRTPFIKPVSSPGGNGMLVLLTFPATTTPVGGGVVIVVGIGGGVGGAM